MIEDIGSAVILVITGESRFKILPGLSVQGNDIIRLYAAPAGFYQMPSARSVISRTDTFPSRSSYR